LVEKCPYLANFVLDRHTVGLPENIRVFVYYNPTHICRSSGLIYKRDALDDTSSLFCEIAHFPFGFVLSTNGGIVDKRLTEVTFFSLFHQNEIRSVALKIPTFCPVDSVSGNYLDFEDVRAITNGNWKSHQKQKYGDIPISEERIMESLRK